MLILKLKSSVLLNIQHILKPKAREFAEWHILRWLIRKVYFSDSCTYSRYSRSRIWEQAQCLKRMLRNVIKMCWDAAVWEIGHVCLLRFRVKCFENRREQALLNHPDFCGDFLLRFSCTSAVEDGENGCYKGSATPAQNACRTFIARQSSLQDNVLLGRGLSTANLYACYQQSTTQRCSKR